MLETLPSLEVMVVLPQASVADAVPRAPLISAADGLHPNVVVVPPVVIDGTALSTEKENLILNPSPLVEKDF